MKTLRVTLKYALVLLLLLVAVGGWYGYQQWVRRGELIRQQILSQAAQLAPHWDVRIGACRLELLNRVRLENLSLGARDQARPILTLPQLQVTLDAQQLFDSGQVRINKVRILRPRLEVIEEADGRWNFQALLPLPQLGKKPLPEIEVEQGTIVVHRPPTDGKVAPPLVFSDVRLSLIPSARRRFRLTGDLHAGPFGQIALTGRWDVDAGSFVLDGEIPELALSHDLIQLAGQLAPPIQQRVTACEQFLLKRLAKREALSPALRSRSPSLPGSSSTPSTAPSLAYSYASQTRSSGPPDRAGPQPSNRAGSDSSSSAHSSSLAVRAGSVDRGAVWTLPMPDGVLSEPLLQISATGRVNFRIQKDAAEAQPQFKLLVTLLRGSVRTAAVPYEATTLAGKLYCDNRRLIARNIMLGSGATKLVLDGAFSFCDEERPAEFDVTVENLACDEWFRSQLNEGLQRVYDLLRPRGLLDVTVHLQRTGPDTWKPSRLTAKVHDGSIRHVAFPYPIGNIHGTIVQDGNVLRVDAEGDANGRTVLMSGVVKNPGPEAEGRFRVQVRGLPIDDVFVAACPLPVQATIRSLALKGHMDVDLTLTRQPGLGQQYKPTFTLRITDGVMQYDKFPYRIANLEGTVHFAGDQWRFVDVSGTHDSARLHASGLYAKVLGASELHLKVDATDVALDESLRLALSDSLQRLWADLRPGGRANVRASLDWVENQPVQIVLQDVEIFGGRLELVSFPYPISDVRASCSYRDGHVEVTSFRGKHGDTQITAHGFVTIDPRGDWTTHFEDLSVKRLVPDNEFRRALPPALRTVFACLNPDQPIALRGMLELRGTQRPTDPITAAWDLETRFFGGQITAGLDYKDLVGTIRARGVWNGYELEVFDGRIELERATVLGHRLTDIRGPFAVKNGMIIIGSRESVLPGTPGHTQRAVSPNEHVTARAIDGIIELDAVATLEDDPTYRVRVLLKDGRLEKYAQEYMHGEKNLRGVMNGWLVLSGRGSDPRNVRGRGQLKIQPAELYELPVIVQILNVLRLAPPDKTAFRYALLDFDIADAQFRFQGIYLDGTSLSLRGRGTASFDGTLKLDFYSMLPRAPYPIPVVNVLLREATRGWVGVEVRGKVDAPVARTKPVPNLDETLKGFLNALPKLGPPVLPPPPPPPSRRVPRPSFSHP